MKNCWRIFKNISVVAVGLVLSQAAFAGYGAIAFSPSTYTVSQSHGYSYLQEAEQAALSSCGLSDCKIMNWEQNKCNAFATDQSSGHWGRATGMSDANSAVNAAVQACGTANCVSRVWICG